MENRHIILRIVLGGVALAHILIGLGGIVPAVPIDVIASTVYGAQVTVNSQVEHIVRMFGAYMLTVGLLAAFAAVKPAKNTSAIYAVSFLLLVRVIQRLFFAGQAEAVFGIAPAWYWVQTAVFLAVPVFLVLLKPKSSETAGA